MKETLRLDMAVSHIDSSHKCRIYSYVSSSFGTQFLFLRLDTPVTWLCKKCFSWTLPVQIVYIGIMSSVTNSGTNWYYCAAPGWTSDDRKRGRYVHMRNVQLYASPSKKKAPSERKKVAWTSFKKSSRQS